MLSPMKPLLVAAALMFFPACSGTAGEQLETSEPTGKRHGVSTHCGVVSTTVDDVLWLADPRLGDDSGNPPAGWDENETAGLFVIETDNTARFTADSGVEATFTRAASGALDPVDGCD
jgi:hypothetical protein